MGAIDKKISELEELTTPAVNDLIPIVDVSVADFQTKYITTTNLVTGGIIAPADPQYVVLAVHAGLPNERVLTGTANQVIVTDGGAGGNVTLSTPQDINVGSTPTFAGLTINGNITVTGTVDGVDIAGIADAQYVVIAADADLANERILTGTANQVVVTDGGAGGPVTLSLPQNIHILATPQFDGMTLTGQLLIDGGVDEIQLVIQGDAAQTASLQEWQDSAGNTLLEILSDGDIKTDRWLDQDSNTFMGVDVVGAGNLAHAAGDEGYYNVGLGNQALYSITSGYVNIGIGYDALYSITSGAGNTAIGRDAGYSVTIGLQNFMMGTEAGYSTQDGGYNNFWGYQAGYTNVSGQFNNFIGYQAGYDNTGSNNIFIGYRTGYENIGGGHNNFIGYQAGLSNTTGEYNIFIGTYAGQANIDGSSNVFIGRDSGILSTTNNQAVFIGYRAGYSITDALYNTAIGGSSLYFNSTGAYNVCVGYQAGYGVTGKSHTRSVYLGYRAGRLIETGNRNIAIGYQSGSVISTGGNNIVIGYQSGDLITTGSNNIIIGYDIDPTANNVSNQLNIGDLIYGNIGSAQAGINVTPPNLAASFHVDQPAADGAEPVLLLDQADIDYVLMKIIGTAEAASADRTLVADSDYGTPGALVGWIQAEVQDDGNRIADGDYYIPFYAVPT